MSLEITLRVTGLEQLNSRQDDSSEKLVRLLQELDGILEVRFDSNTGRFAVRYNPNRITIFRILIRIELAGRRNGLDYRPTDVQTSQEDSYTSPSHHVAPDEAAHPVLSERS